MRLDGDLLRLSATDLANHLGCRHLTRLERAVAEGRTERPVRHDPLLEILVQRGLEHEAAYVASLAQEGLVVDRPAEEDAGRSPAGCHADDRDADAGSTDARPGAGRRTDGGAADARDGDAQTGPARTLAAMRAGADVIVQADLVHGRWHGRADLLLRVPEPSALGDWSYEVADTKLARDTRGGTVLQLCLYSEMLERLQGRAPTWMHVIKPGDPFERERYRLAEFRAYFRQVQARLERAVGGAAASDGTHGDGDAAEGAVDGDGGAPDEAADGDTYPLPVEQCAYCTWWSSCEARRHADDHLCLVAGMSTLHAAEIERQGASTLEAFARSEVPLAAEPERGSMETYRGLHAQARVQLRGREADAPTIDFRDVEDGRGFLRLPEPSPGDVFFDFEGDPFVADGGLEYMHGWAVRGAGGALEYHVLWALDRDGERAAFEAFVDGIMTRWDQHPGMHVYHFAPYEPAAVKRLVNRYATRQREVDRLLRGGRFVDLHAVTRQALHASVERYTLKDLERFHDFERGLDLREASAALRRVECALELGRPEEVLAEDRAAVEVYNRDDCLSTASLRDWLEERRAELEASGESLPRPELGDGDASEAVEERDADVQELFDALTADLPDDRAAWGEGESARWLLAHLLDYFRRENKSAWWEFFRLRDLDHDALLHERKALAGLELEGTVGGTAKCPIHRYRFPPQEASMAKGRALHEVDGDAIGTLHALDLDAMTVDVRKRGDSRDVHPWAVQVDETVRSKDLDASLLALAHSVLEHGLDGDGPHRAARDLLLRRPPRRAPDAGPMQREGEDPLEAVRRVTAELEDGVLPIQGPPGTGKSYKCARTILDFVVAGKRVGVTAVSHKVIRNLLDEVARIADEEGLDVALCQKVSDEPDPAGPVLETKDNPAALAQLAAGAVVGGTAWLWARTEAEASVDHLFVDEAGQMALAMVLAVARAARNLVLLGDPQQLEQPQRASHPEGAEVAALSHVIGDHATIEPERGLFLDTTWRMHPSLCAFTSEIYYEGRLRARPGLERQAVAGVDGLPPDGLVFVPTEHEGCQSHSPEEVEAVAGLVERLLRPGVNWTDRHGTEHPLDASGILVVAPYNAQVAALSARLAGLRIGTVDKFQGQQAPVVIYSMTSSSADDAPRGLGFLFSPNRLNVATSRAHCLCLLVATPRVFEASCRTPEQMRWVNGLCRARELAGTRGEEAGV